jgi:hypothetical protein
MKTLYFYYLQFQLWNRARIRQELDNQIQGLTGKPAPIPPPAKSSPGQNQVLALEYMRTLLMLAHVISLWLMFFIAYHPPAADSRPPSSHPSHRISNQEET